MTNSYDTAEYLYSKLDDYDPGSDEWKSIMKDIETLEKVNQAKEELRFKKELESYNSQQKEDDAKKEEERREKEAEENAKDKFWAKVFSVVSLALPIGVNIVMKCEDKKMLKWLTGVDIAASEDGHIIRGKGYKFYEDQKTKSFKV